MLPPIHPERVERSRLRSALLRSDVPVHLHDGLIRYIVDGIRTGSFLQACLENNIGDAHRRADAHGLQRIGDIVGFVTVYVPAAGLGSHAAVELWIEQHKQARAIAAKTL